jgi:hypothetical protein
MHARIKARVGCARELSESLSRDEGVIVQQALTDRLVQELLVETEQDDA